MFRLVLQDRLPHLKKWHPPLPLILVAAKQIECWSDGHVTRFTFPVWALCEPKITPSTPVCIEAPSDRMLDGSTFPGWKMCHFYWKYFSSRKSKRIRLLLGPVLSPTRWWSPITRHARHFVCWACDFMSSTGCASSNQEAAISAEMRGMEVCQKERGQRGRWKKWQIAFEVL